MSQNLLIFLLFLSIISTGQCGKKKNVDKIIIHVPYKILKHHHTHTKYKIITIPEKKEQTVIYVKALEKQPSKKFTALSHFPKPHLEMEIIEEQPKAFYSSQQLSESSVVDIIKDQDGNEPKDQQQDFSNNVHSVKPAQFYTAPQNELTHNNFIPKFSFPQIVSHSYEVSQKPILFQSLIPPSPPPFPHHHPHTIISKVQMKPMMLPPKQGQHHKDIVHSGSNIYKTVITQTLPKMSSYSVREPSQEDNHLQSAKHQPKLSKQFLKKFKVPSLKSYNKITPHYFNQDNNLVYKNSKQNEIKHDVESEYEHVGYLVIDENSQKIVDKNFNEKFHSWG